MKVIFLLSVIHISYNLLPCYAQLYTGIHWQNTIGGSDADEFRIQIKTSDGNFVLGGSSLSDSSGDKTQNSQGNYDYWIIKMHSSGNIQWQKTIGGDFIEGLYSIMESENKGILIGGRSWSGISGDKTDSCRGATDYWILNLDSIGTINWQKTIGGTSSDHLTSIAKSQGIGYLLGGNSSSNISGEKSENCRGGSDFWIIKIDSIGNIQWQKTIGGNDLDFLTVLLNCPDGGYLAGGYSGSNVSGEKSEACRGGFDYWVVKLDASGNILWQRTIGGYYNDQLYGMSGTVDGGFILAGQSWSDISGEKTENSRGAGDYWIVKLDSVGNIQWQKTIGGSEGEYAHSIIQTPDSGYFIGGASASSISGEKTENNRGNSLTGDYWVLKTDSLGTIQWQKTIGGTEDDQLLSVLQTNDNGFMLGGFSNSNAGFEKSEDCQGLYDYWIVKLNGTTGMQEVIDTASVNISPNPATEKITIEMRNLSHGPFRLQLLSMNGSIMKEYSLPTEKRTELGISEIPAGMYLCRILTDHQIFHQKIVIMK